jgi:D-arabinose 1-dehydrogenase-like Zn-dependent alcohol dehydrogenase
MKQTATYNGENKNGNAAVYPEGSKTLGGYTNLHVVNENFGVLLPKEYPLEMAGPVMCVSEYSRSRWYGT